ncbi:tetratricopeptide repeat protein, partial [Candidatus Poribacteria bacterium]|nr:tetratricopeptide repeat protein [Candidatus Poribacteria bacterium]
DNVRSFYYAAAAYHKSDQPDKVEEVLKEAKNALVSSNKRGNESFLGALATICLNNEMLDTAIKLANEAITEAVKSDNSWELEYLYGILGRSYLNAKRYEKAYDTYQKMADAADGSYMRDQAETEMDKIAVTANLYQKWIPALLKKVEENPNDSNAILKLAKSYEKTNKFTQAVEQYEQLSALEPENTQWHKKLGDLYQNLPTEIRETGELIQGTALTLSGNGSFVEMADSESLDSITDQVTVSAWIKPTEFPNNYIRIIFRSDEQKQNYRQRSYILAIRSDGKLKIASSPKDEGYASLYSPPGLIKLNTWTHIAGVIDAKKDYMKLFVNGYEFGHRHFNGEDRFVKCSLPLRIGVTHIKDQVQNTSFIGQIDEVRVWNKPRTEAEIRGDMNKQLNGDEPGLVGYWKFDAELEGNIFDSSPNNNDGKLFGDAKLERYARKVFDSTISDNLSKSIIAYQNAIEFDPTSYQNYDKLAKIYIKKGITSEAEEVYRQALNTPLTQGNHDNAINGICGLYSDEGQENKLIAILEELKPMMKNSAVLHLQLGDLYTSISETDKAKQNYDQWLNIRMHALGGTQSARSLSYFAETLLNKGLYPKTALKFAKRAFQKNYNTSYEYCEILGHACIANGLFDEALNNYLHGLSLISSKYSLSNFWEGIREAIKHTDDEDRFFQMMDAMMDAIPTTNIGNRAHAYRLMTQYYSKYDKAKNVENYLFSKTGFVPETRWLTLGPFNNIDTMGHRNAFIPEETTQIDTTAKYYGKHGLINWKKSKYVQLDGHYNFGDNKNWSAAYVWAIVISPDERDITFRFDSDDQGTIWLNGKQVFSHDRTGSISFDRYSIPVTLKQGENTILIKTCNAKETWGFYLRLTDNIGNPIKDLKFKTSDELLNAPPPLKPKFNVMSVLGMAEYYNKNNMPEKAVEQMQLTGIIHENAWMTLGPFDNTAGIGYNTAYIPEDTKPIDITAKYESANGQIGWKQFADDAFNGYIDLGRNLNWQVSYAWTTVTSPDEREVQLRFGSDDQAKVWLNGKEVHANPQFRWAVIDDNIIPVTLNAGKNTILVKVCNEELGWGFYLRITDVDGKPLDNLKIGNAQNH